MKCNFCILIYIKMCKHLEILELFDCVEDNVGLMVHHFGTDYLNIYLIVLSRDFTSNFFPFVFLNQTSQQLFEKLNFTV